MSLKTRVFALGLAAASLSAPLAQAADHLDGPNVKKDSSTDIGDLYSWMDSTAQVLNLVMTVNPAADKVTSKFSNSALYVFHISAKGSFSDTAQYPEYTVICSFNAASPQIAQCWAGYIGDYSEYVTGNASAATLVSPSGKFKVFAGPRNDPFFFNLAGFNATAASIKAAYPGLTKDTAGCPTITAATTPNILGVKALLASPLPSMDAFGGQNVLAIVVSLDKSLVTTPQRQTITVYASTNKPVP
jgi:hypothetical protein